MIPGTKLYTGLYYKVALKEFPQGWLTWVDGDETYNLIIDIDPSQLAKYKKGGSKELDNQWVISPSKTARQFTLTNRRKPNGLLSYTKASFASGHQAAILENPDVRKTLMPGGKRRKDALWKFSVEKAGEKYVKMQNVGGAGYSLTWSHSKFNKDNYYIEIANYDPKNDAKLWFKSAGIKLNARVSDFQFKSEPTAVFAEKKNQKQSLVSKHRFANNSTATITQSLEESVETKESFTFSFKESLSMMYSTTMEVSAFAIASVSSTFSFTGGFEASQAKTKETTKKTTLKTDIQVPPHTDTEASIYSVFADNVVLPFKAKMTVTGLAERIVADDPSETQDGEVPGDVIEAYIMETGGKNMKIIKRNGSNIEVEVNGEIKGNVGIESTVSTSEIKRS